MAISVEFRGVCLFVKKGTILERVLVPNAAEGVTPRDGTAGPPVLHADDAPAWPHYAGLLVLDAQGKPIRQIQPLRGRVTIWDGAAGARLPACVYGPVNHMASLNCITNAGAAHDLVVLSDTDPELEERAAASVVPKGGTIKLSTVATLPESNKQWTVTDAFKQRHGFTKRNLAISLGWQATGSTATLTIGPWWPVPPGEDEVESIPLTNGQRAYIYNTDEKTPTADFLDGKLPTPSLRSCVDEDFKWLYQVLRPMNGLTLREWITKGTFKPPTPAEPEAGEKPHLPAPRLDPCPKSAPPHPDVSTCFPGDWDD